MLTTDQIEHFRRDGFLKGNVVLTEREIGELASDFGAVTSSKTDRKPILNHAMRSDSGDVTQVINAWMASTAFFEHAANTSICEEISQLCASDTLRIWHDQILYKRAGGGGSLDWHQDHPYWPVLAPADLVTSWVSLDDAMIDNGCMWMVPGSHLWGDQLAHLGYDSQFMPRHRRPDLLPPDAIVRAVPIELRRGEVHYHHCLTWHGSPANRSERERRAFAVHYMPGHTYFVDGGGHPMKSHISNAPGEIISGPSFPVVFTQPPP